MSTLNGILSIASSALQVAQTGLNVVSDNVSNVNTTGYVRKIVQQESLAYGGHGAGVEVAQISRVADAYLQQTSLNAAADSSSFGAIANSLNQAQQLFGDPSSTGSLFSQLDKIFSSFSALASSPSSVSQSQALSSVQNFFNSSSQISKSLQNLQTQADNRITDDVTQANALLQKISDLNTQIAQGAYGQQDVTGYQNQQSQYIDQLSKLVDIRVSQDGAPGTTTVRASDGTALTTAGRSPAVFSYDQSNGNGQIFFTPPGGQLQPYGTRLKSGEIEGLLTARNTSIPNVAQQLGEFTAETAATVNQVSNAYSATPAPASLTGKDPGIDVPTAVSTFTGKTTFAIVNAQGVIQSKVLVDFSAGTLSVNGGAATSFTPANFISSLNTALSPAGGASVSGATISLTAAGGNGIVVADDAATPSQSGGKGFSQYFGLNDVVASNGLADYNTGLSASTSSGFTSGTIKFRIAGPDGTDVADISVSPTSGQTIGQFVTQLNSTSSGLGLYGTFSLDAKGAITFAPKSGSNTHLNVVSDTTAWNGSGLGFTQLFGLDQTASANRATNLSVSQALLQQPSLLPNAALNLSAGAGATALSSGDTRGSDALAQAGSTIRSFQAAGGAPSTLVSLSDYSASFSSRIGSTAAAAATNQTNADAQATEAQSRRSGVEGVNLDQELISLTTYQQAYNASARLLTAAKDMYDTLLQLVP